MFLIYSGFLTKRFSLCFCINTSYISSWFFSPFACNLSYRPSVLIKSKMHYSSDIVIVEDARVPEGSVLQAVPSPGVRTLLPRRAAAFLWGSPVLQQARVDPSLVPHHIQVRLCCWLKSAALASSLYCCCSYIHAYMAST